MYPINFLSYQISFHLNRSFPTFRWVCKFSLGPIWPTPKPAKQSQTTSSRFWMPSILYYNLSCLLVSSNLAHGLSRSRDPRICPTRVICWLTGFLKSRTQISRVFRVNWNLYAASETSAGFSIRERNYSASKYKLGGHCVLIRQMMMSKQKRNIGCDNRIG